jgi:hypothetical protein
MYILIVPVPIEPVIPDFEASVVTPNVALLPKAVVVTFVYGKD